MTFIKNAWYVAGWESEFGNGLFKRRLLGKDIVFYRCMDGSITALEDRCCHRAAPLSSGQLEGDQLRCMYHGLLFNRSGQCVEVPGQERVSDKLCVRRFPTVAHDRLLWIWMGAPALADAEQIVECHWHDRDGWRSQEGGYIAYASSLQLIVDNLLDFSHLGFVHNRSIGTRTQGAIRPVVNFGDETVNVNFTTLNSSPPAFVRALSNVPDVVDRFNYYDWHIRGNLFVQNSVIAPVETGYDSDDPTAIKLHTFIALTPVDENNTHYFWSTAHNDFASEVPDLTRRLTERVADAFEEDRAIIEAQQRVVSNAPDVPFMAIAADGTLLRIRRMLDAMIGREKAAEDGVDRDTPVLLAQGER